MHGEIAGVDAISARALASLPVLLDYAAPFALANPKLELWFHKGLDYPGEVRSARDLWGFDLIEHSSLAQDGSAILQISKLSKRN